MVTVESQDTKIRDVLESIYIAPIRNIAFIDDQFDSLLSLLKGKEDSDETNESFKLSQEALEEDKYLSEVDPISTKDEKSTGTGSTEEATLKEKKDLKETLIGLLGSCGEKYLPFVERNHKPADSIINNSDLFVLDYYLTPEENPVHCLNILNRFLNRERFCLGVIYTREDPRGVGNRLSFALRGRGPMEIKPKKPKQELSREDQAKLINDYLGGVELAQKDYGFKDKSQLLAAAAYYSEEDFKSTFPDYTLPAYDEDIQLGISGKHPWIKGKNLFLVIINKADHPLNSIDEITNSIIGALQDAPPTPISMIVQNCINELKFQAPNIIKKIFKNDSLKAGILFHALSQEYPTVREEKRKFELACLEIISQIMEELAHPVTSVVSENVIKILNYVTNGEAPSPGELAMLEVLNTAKKLENCSLDDKQVMLHLNAQLCSHTHNFDYISMGTVFKYDGKFWICTTPSCDMVPGRTKGGSCQRVVLQPANYFFACKLKELKNETEQEEALSNADQGKHIFISIGDSVKIFAIYNLAGHPAPFVFYTANGGYLESDKKIKLHNVSFDKDSSEFSCLEKDAEVIAQVRHLYATRILHNLGSYYSRVGVDFRNLKQIETQEN